MERILGVCLRAGRFTTWLLVLMLIPAVGVYGQGQGGGPPGGGGGGDDDGGDDPAFTLTALDDYVALEDPNYSFDHYHTSTSLFATTYFLTMTSQQWRTSAEVDRPIWEHHLQIIVPSTRASSTAIQFVDGGSNTSAPPTSVDSDLELLAFDAGMVLANIKQIPNQPLFFTDEDNVSRSEDAIIAYSFDKFLVTGDEFWPVLLPMTKAVVRSMDTVQTFLGSLRGRNKVTINDFIVGGGSKRGWTTHLVSAVEQAGDSRVKATFPLVIDFLNSELHVDHHWEVYGFYAPAIQDYADFDIFCRAKVEDPDGILMSIVDPFSYNERLTFPKLLVYSAGDQFFVPTSSQFYFSQLSGTNHLRYAPNTDHSLSQDSTIIPGIVQWVKDIEDNNTLPSYSWSFETDGSIRVDTQTAPEQVLLWQATNPDARDFRMEIIGQAWTATELTDQGGGVYIGSVEEPAQGFTAFLVEVNFGNDHIFSTEVRVSPDILPFEGTHCAE